MLRLLKILLFLGLMAPNMAMAGPKPVEWLWWPWHWDWQEVQNFNPHLENSKHPHNNQWANQNFRANDWFSQKSPRELVSFYYNSQILHKINQDDDVTTVYVGPQFYRMSGHDKRRIVHTLDVANNYTSGGQALILRDWHTKRPIGIYTQAGLQIQ